MQNIGRSIPLTSYKQLLKGATKLHFMYYFRVVIILFSTCLYKSAFSTYDFGKTSFSSFCVLVLRVSVAWVLIFSFALCFEFNAFSKT